MGEKNDSRNRFVDIGLENVAVAAARVVGAPTAAVIRWVKSVDVYRAPAKKIFASSTFTPRGLD